LVEQAVKIVIQLFQQWQSVKDVDPQIPTPR